MIPRRADSRRTSISLKFEALANSSAQVDSRLNCITTSRSASSLKGKSYDEVMGGGFLSSYLHVVVCILLTITDKLAGWGGLEVVLPVGHTALSGDLEAHVTGGWAGLTGRLQLLERSTDPSGPILSRSSNQIDDELESGQSTADGETDGWSSMGSIPLTWTNSSSLQVRFPCGVITRGGRYGVKLVADVTNSSMAPPQIVELDVRWPSASLNLTPHEIQTYPEGNVTATVTFQTTFCQPALGSILPETWLDLLYCGHSPLGCTFPNSTHSQLVYSEQIRGFPTLRYVPLGCQLFGMAGHYALALRPRILDGEPIAATPPKNTLKALWSDKFVFNVHARSIFPCDGHSGVPVLFQYPKCILPTGDRVRLFSRLRADVSSLVPPTSLHYVSEQKVANGKHSLRFDCSLFSERYVEYCFVYVSQSITGAVSDVRMDCVPTLPVLDYETGGWGEWSPWTQCTSTCSGGTRNRYRFCDSPPPRYGAKFCQGHALETETCGVAGAWDCRYYPDTGSGEVPADRPEVKAEIGPGCRCGCIVHLGTGKSRRLIAASSHSCPGRTFWLIQTEKDRSVRLSMEQFRLPCFSQSLKIRDGDSSSGEMLARLSGTPLQVPAIVSSGPSLLIEFNAGDVVTSGEECSGGFLAHASQVERQESNLSRALVAHSTISGGDEEMWTGPGLVNAGLALTLLLAVVASACLGIQYVYRYHKYQLAARQDDMDSFADNNSCGSMPIGRSRATSSTTLLSEVISLQRFRSNKHARLAEEDIEMQDETASKVDEGTELLDKTSNDDELRSDAGSDSEKRPTSLEVPKTPQLPRRQLRLLKNRKFISPVSPVAEGPEDDASGANGGDAGTLKAPKRSKSRAMSRPSASSSQSSTLTNGSSPPSTASISGLPSSKECKEKRNRERMLAGSEFSLNGPDLEMDYYDYNVQNAVPGSYLAMDPAYCLWIPPFAPGVWEEETEFMGGDEETSTKSEKSEEVYKSADSLNFKANDLNRSASNRALNTVIYTTEDDSSTGLVEKAAVESPVKEQEMNGGIENPGASISLGSEYYDLLENEGGIRFADDDEEEEDCSTVLEDLSDVEKEAKDMNIREKDSKSTVIVQVHARSAIYNK
ncbi:hypothetical protein GE061_013107 [Apolygus lucorum]|uniref:Uncharacterized protein n=2 Tax=Mirini TaxID=236659 RepID=A0A6A4IZQ8_APOLU|nr:hypothetical protein GE061_013107 [Apolygus lucorum]